MMKMALIENIALSLKSPCQLLEGKEIRVRHQTQN
jgi:hypothetical protein